MGDILLSILFIHSIWSELVSKGKADVIVETWKDLESVVQSELNQKKKRKYHILTHICGV